MSKQLQLRYIAPNALTACSLILGLVAIIRAGQGDYVLAAWLIVWCALLDIADGKVARWLHASSNFGLQFDSLADLLAFCAAPALLIYFTLTSDSRYAPMFTDWLTKSWLVVACSIYLLAGALRLARYNIQAETMQHKRFAGMPTTIAGALVATYILTAWEWNLSDTMIILSPVLLLLSGLLMICNLSLPRNLNVKGKSRSWPKLLFFTAIFIIAGSRSFPSVLFICALAYPLIGFSLGLRRTTFPGEL